MRLLPFFKGMVEDEAVEERSGGMAHGLILTYGAKGRVLSVNCRGERILIYRSYCAEVLGRKETPGEPAPNLKHVIN